MLQLFQIVSNLMFVSSYLYRIENKAFANIILVYIQSDLRNVTCEEKSTEELYVNFTRIKGIHRNILTIFLFPATL